MNVLSAFHQVVALRLHAKANPSRIVYIHLEDLQVQFSIFRLCDPFFSFLYYVLSFANLYPFEG